MSIGVTLEIFQTVAHGHFNTIGSSVTSRRKSQSTYRQYVSRNNERNEVLCDHTVGSLYELFGVLLLLGCFDPNICDQMGGRIVILCKVVPLNNFTTVLGIATQITSLAAGILGPTNFSRSIYMLRISKAPRIKWVSDLEFVPSDA